MNQNQKLIDGILNYLCNRENESDVVQFLKANYVIEDTQQASDDFSYWLSEFDAAKNVT